MTDLPDIPDRRSAAMAAQSEAMRFLEMYRDDFEELFDDLPDPNVDVREFKAEVRRRMEDFQVKLNVALGSPVQSFARTFDIPEEMVDWAVRVETLVGDFATALVNFVDNAVRENFNSTVEDGPRMLSGPSGTGNPMIDSLMRMLGAEPIMDSENIPDMKRRIDEERERQKDQPKDMPEDDIQAWLDSIPETDEG